MGAPGEESPKYALTNFTPEEFQKFWPNLEDMLDKVPHTWRHWTKDYIFSSALNNTVQVWGIGPPPNAVLVFFTQIAMYPAQKVLCLVWAAGSFKPDMLPLMKATMMNYARLNSCNEIEIRGRRGWEPHFRAAGMTRDSVVWTCKVPNVRIH
jgi:hypothetical protein